MIILGTHSDSTKGILLIPKTDLLYHTAFVGQSGSGKSFAIARLLEEIALRTRARTIILDPNGDFGAFYQIRENAFWKSDDFAPTFSRISSKTPQDIRRYDENEEFNSRWNSLKFQFVTAERTNWTPYREGANAAPLKVHWKWLLPAEQDYLLSVDTTEYPAIHQGVITCFHYIRDHSEEFPQEYSLEDLEGIAQNFALKRVVMADYPEAHSLTDIDWLSVRLQFRSLRKKFHKLWYPGRLADKEHAPSDIANYIHNGFWDHDPWQVCTVSLAGLESSHMHLAANITLSCLWHEAVSAWQRERQRAAERGGGQDRRVPTFVVIDEAHNFAPEEPITPLQARTSEKIATIAAEGRKYGLFLILATQRPTKLRRGLLSECENACLLRIQSKMERTFAAEALGEAPETVHKVGEFDTGEALMVGPWVSGTPTINFGPARTTLGGGGLDKCYWQDI